MLLVRVIFMDNSVPQCVARAIGVASVAPFTAKPASEAFKFRTYRGLSVNLTESAQNGDLTLQQVSTDDYYLD